MRAAASQRIAGNELQLRGATAPRTGGGEMFPNPFTTPPQVDPRRTYQPPSARDRIGPPRKGTHVTVRAYDIPNLPGPQQHMYVEYDDGREQLIARGGPSAEGDTFVPSSLAGRLRVVGGVVPATQSKDYGKGERVVFRGFAPDMSAQEAAEPARRNGRALQEQPRQYGIWRDNSNSFAADAVEPLFGIRPGSAWRTPGHGNTLTKARGVHSWYVPARESMR